MTHKIMVVDDNSATRRMVKNALVRKGHSVIEAPDGKTALALMQSEQPRVVLQDLVLPDADGFRLVGQLRSLARGSDVSILAFSGFVSELDEARVSTVGFDDIIAKPIAPSRLVPLVEAHLPSMGRTELGAGRRVVIADDDPMQLKLATFRLSRLGFAVEAVGDGRAALAAAQRTRPDVIVSDVMMPDLDGFSLVMAVRQDAALSSVPILLVTSSYVESADRDLARRAGANDLVPRTPELGELVDALRTILTTTDTARVLEPAAVGELEKEHNARVFRQLERQVLLNSGLAKRCSALASELTVLAGISEAVLAGGAVGEALEGALAECFDAGGVAVGALYLVEPEGIVVRAISATRPGEAEQLATLFGHRELLEEVVRGNRTLYVPSGELPHELEAELLERAEANAILVVPLHDVGASLGSLLMIARSRELDREDWRTFAHGVATQIAHVLSLARAYDERERAQRLATERAALLDAVIESAPDHLMHLALDGTIRFINRAMAPFQATEVIGRTIFEFQTGDHAVALRRALARLAETGEAQGFEASMFGSDGVQVWYSTRLGPVRDGAGKVIGAVVVSRDVSDNKQTEMHLMLSDRMASVGTLAAGVAHEINNPLAAVIANLDMAMHDVETLAQRQNIPPDLADELKDARTAADRVREIVRDLKIFSRADEDQHGPVDIELVLESTLRMAWNELRHRAKLIKQYTKVPPVDANESRLGQVFLNLVINAAHAIPLGKYESNQIRVSTHRDQDRVIVTIADTGCGIPESARPRLFTPFFTTKPVGVGTGLGLAISHRIITQFGGTIAYESEVDKGTEFRVTLPIAGSSIRRDTQRVWTSAPAMRRGRVLVIDDEEALALAIKRYLSADHEVTAVHRAREALDLVEGGARYDVVLCDLMMPQITGMELYTQIVQLDPEQARRIVFVTGGAFTSGAREFLDGSKNRRLEKPFDLHDLRRVVNEVIK